MRAKRRGKGITKRGVIQDVCSVDIMWLCFQQLQMSGHCSVCSKCHMCRKVCAVTFPTLYQQGRTVCRVSGTLQGVILWNASAHIRWCHRNPISSHGCQPVYLLNASLDTVRGFRINPPHLLNLLYCNWPEPITLQHKWVLDSAFANA